MLKFGMKKLYALILLVFCGVAHAKEPTIMILDRIFYNDMHLFHKAQQFYICQPYGVLTVDILIRQQKKLTTSCQNALQKLMIKEPMLKYFAREKLYIGQSYHVEVLKEGCLIFSQSQRTYSEQLLKRGLAIMDPKMKNEEYFGYFTTAMQYAKNHKKGIWQDSQVETCILEVTSKKK
jgi:hypothetical protein